MGIRINNNSIQNVVDRFVDNSVKHPDTYAVIHGEEYITYGELNKLSNQIAHLLKEYGIQEGTLVAISFPVSFNTVVFILAILKLGAVYVPVDANLPEDRRIEMISGLPTINFIIFQGDGRLVSTVKNLTVINPYESLERSKKYPSTAVETDLGPSDLCYAVFTSGTTGIAKATAVRHEGWANLLSWFEREFSLYENANNLLVTAFGFDISQRSIMAPLYMGATLIIPESKVFDPTESCQLIHKHNVHTLHIAPSTLYMIVNRSMETSISLEPLKYAFIGGEPLNLKQLERWYRETQNKFELIHQYGTAECTDVSSSYRIQDFDDCLQNGIPLGNPVANNFIEILDEDQCPTHRGVGEIYIGGCGVGAGYLNNIELTGNKFSVINGSYLYRTGDLAKRRHDGEIIFVGRADNQVKLRGYRIDLGDIESGIRKLDGAVEAVVFPRAYIADKAEPLLIAFVEFDPRKIDECPVDEPALRRELRKILPAYMVPTFFHTVDTMPLTPNGKIDRKALQKLLPRQRA